MGLGLQADVRNVVTERDKKHTPLSRISVLLHVGRVCSWRPLTGLEAGALFINSPLLCIRYSPYRTDTGGAREAYCARGAVSGPQQPLR